MKRIFVAVDISDGVRHAAAEYTAGLSQAFPHLRVGWERPEKLHLTLKFLGDVNESDLARVQGAIGKLASESTVFEMSIGGTGTFPSRGEPRILWLGAKDAGHLEAIALRVESELEPLGFEREKRRFSPHLTIARLREPRQSFELATRHLENDLGPISFKVREVVIYESRLLAKGSVYSHNARYPLRES